MVLHTVVMWGWTDPCLTVARRQYIAKAACHLVAYDLGYASTLAYSRIPLWYGSLNDAITDGENADPLSPSLPPLFLSSLTQTLKKLVHMIS